MRLQARSVLLAVFLVVLSSNAWGIMRLGLQGGYTSSNFSGTNDTARSSFLAGALLELGLGGSLALQPEANYVQKGAVAGPNTLEYNYFEIPVYLKYTLDIAILKPFLGVGPYFGFTTKTANAVGGVTTSLPGVASSDFGFSGMGGVELAFTPFTSLFAEARYDLGLTNLDSSGVTSYHNRSFGLLAGLIVGM